MDNTAESKGERIAKVMARAGICSRREAERYIDAGRVSVNGAVLNTPATVVTDDDVIAVDGCELPRKERTRLFLYHKPAGLVTTARDEKGRKTVFDALPAGLPRVISVGRLDMNTEGLLLLTNDGELSRALELPATGWKRCYRVRVFGRVNQDRLDKLKKGITVEGVKYGSIEATLESTKGSNSWIAMTLTEGKNREIRRVLEALNLKVNRLIRNSYGPFELKDLAEGTVVEVPEDLLKHYCGEFLSS